MSQIKPTHLLLSALLALALGGCGDKNNKAVFTADSGHPSNWVGTHKTTAQSGVESCVECHGENLDGGIAQVACSTCHVGATPVGTNATGCISCHGKPPNGTSFATSFPNRKLSHDAHLNLPSVGVNFCNTCHNGFGYNTPDHGTLAAARLSIDPSFQAKQASSAPTYSRDAATGNITCKNVSCHGGGDGTAGKPPQPVWGTPITACESCHQLGTALATPENNSYFSGISQLGANETPPMPNQHERHLKKNGAVCVDCHDSVFLQNKAQHFGKLVSKDSITLTSGNTIGGLNTQIGAYDKNAKTCKSVSCHPDSIKNAPMPWVNFN